MATTAPRSGWSSGAGSRTTANGRIGGRLSVIGYASMPWALRVVNNV
jgi:hypothetical protein